jgi:hypothetical protein
MDTISTPLSQIREVAKSSNEAGREEIIDALRSLSYEIETPYDVLNRFAALVRNCVPLFSAFWDLG